MLADHYTSVELGRLRRPRSCWAVGLPRNEAAGKPLGRFEPTSTFSYRHRRQPTTLSDIADVTARSGARAPVLATAMS